MPRVVARRNVRLYLACGELVREVDRAADEADAAGLRHLGQWMRRSVLTLALLVAEREPDEDRTVREIERVVEDLLVFGRHVGPCLPALRALDLLDRVRVMVEIPAGEEGTPTVIREPQPTSPG